MIICVNWFNFRESAVKVADFVVMSFLKFLILFASA